MSSTPDQSLTENRLELQREGSIAILRLFNPPSGCMDERMEADLTQALDTLDADGAVRVVILTGRDRGMFVRHYDVRVLERHARQMADRGMQFSLERPVPEAGIHRCFSRIENSDRIFIAAINGTCMGGGYELALSCDLRYAEQGDYRIGLPEINLGILPGAGGTQKLPLLQGSARALENLLLGRTFKPEEAARNSMVNACVPSVLEHAIGIAKAISAKPARAASHIKRLVRHPGTGLADERTLFCDLMMTPEAIHLMSEMNAGRRDITE